MSAHFTIHLSKHQKRQLKKIYRTENNSKSSRRAHMLLLNNKGLSIDQIADICLCHRDTVSSAIKRFSKEGFHGLQDKQRSGSPRILNEQDEAYLFACLRDTPMHFGYFATVWTAQMMVHLLQDKRNKTISESAIKGLLKERNWKWNRPKQVPPPPEPINQNEKQEIIRLLTNPQDDEILLFQDEMDLELLPRITGAWMPVGEQMRVATPGVNKVTCIFGFFNPHNKDFFYKMVRTRKQKTAKNFIAVLHQIRYLHPGKKINIVVDNASIHSRKTKLLLQFLQNYQDQVKIHFLPKRCPNLNTIERFWNFCKLRVATNWFYGTQDELERAFRRFIWHYRQGEIAYNFDRRKLIQIWQKHPTIEESQEQNEQDMENVA